MVIRCLALAAAVLTLALVAAETALACSCVPIDPESRVEEADGAVIARLLAVEPVGSFSARFVYRTGRVYKGRPRLKRGRRLVVRSSRSSASCGLSQNVGRLTGLFLYRERGRWTSNSCNEVTPAQMRSLDEPGAARAGGGPGCPEAGAVAAALR